MIPTKTPKILKKLFPDYVWDIPCDHKKKLYLTFDDGPIPDVTEFVLNQLKRYNAKATFFCIGDNIRKHPSIFQQIVSEGHTIGNHTMNHLKAWRNNLENYIHNTVDCQKTISKYTPENYTQLLFRPPHGQISQAKLRELKKLGYSIILWDVLSKDWKQNISPEICAQNVIKNAKEGSIIVFHDSIKASKNLKEALPKVLDYFTELGYTFESIKLKHTLS
ncbi:polysaccharide deacetylase family protein [Aquimarina sp. I32.4]|uniref:polysaccharide deacetylase family protein n=1 Tax=Aquimarina sp. I32.4 TaxID=2053903 RepID=UPI003518786C